MSDPLAFPTRAAQVSTVTAYRRALLAGGVVSILTGLTVLIWPDRTLLLIAALLGVWLIMIGLLRLGEALTAREDTAGHRALTAAAGIVYVAVGIVCLTNLVGTVRLLALILGLVWIVGGLFEISRGLTRGARGWARTGSLLMGLLSVAAGLILLFWPRVSLTDIVWVAGLWLVLAGLIQLLLALVVKPEAVIEADATEHPPFRDSSPGLL